MAWPLGTASDQRRKMPPTSRCRRWWTWRSKWEAATTASGVLPRTASPRRSVAWIHIVGLEER